MPNIAKVLRAVTSPTTARPKWGAPDGSVEPKDSPSLDERRWLP